jgi:hypothetical protein
MSTQEQRRVSKKSRDSEWPDEKPHGPIRREWTAMDEQATQEGIAIRKMLGMRPSKRKRD